MKYKIVIEIALDQISLFDLAIDRSHLPNWPSGYSEVELISGIPGKAGAVYRLTIDRKGAPMVVEEKIISVTAPYEYVSAYTWQGFSVTTLSRFVKVGQNNTTYIAEAEAKASNPLFTFLYFLMTYTIKSQARKKMI